MLSRARINSKITSNIEEIASAQKIILPGVGAFDSAMKKIDASPELRNVLNEKAQIEKIPILGLCLGMQLMLARSEEGSLGGLGWVGGKAVKFRKIDGLRVPQMGWNTIIRIGKDPIFEDLEENPRFYFAHSYYAEVTEPNEIIMKTNYGYEITAGFRKENIYGFQFHPEKSHKYGLQLLQNFGKI